MSKLLSNSYREEDLRIMTRGFLEMYNNITTTTKNNTTFSFLRG